MPRVDSGAVGAGLHVPGAYQALLDSERERYYRYGETIVCDGRELQVSWADPDDHSAGFFCRSRTLLDALEAGKTVVMKRWMVGNLRSNPPVNLPWDRSVQAVSVSPYEVVHSVEGRGDWPGCAAADYDPD